MLINDSFPQLKDASAWRSYTIRVSGTEHSVVVNRDVHEIIQKVLREEDWTLEKNPSFREIQFYYVIDEHVKQYQDCLKKGMKRTKVCLFQL